MVKRTILICLNPLVEGNILVECKKPNGWNCSHALKSYFIVDEQPKRTWPVTFQISIQSLIINHEWTRMFMISPLNTRKKRNASQTLAIVQRILWEEGDSWGRRIGRPPSARRFVTLRASANNVMRKLWRPWVSARPDSGGCGGCESASRDRKMHGKIFVKNKKIK